MFALSPSQATRVFGRSLDCPATTRNICWCLCRKIWTEGRSSVTLPEKACRGARIAEQERGGEPSLGESRKCAPTKSNGLTRTGLQNACCKGPQEICAMRFRIHPDALQEADDAVDWYGAAGRPIRHRVRAMYSMMIREIYTPSSAVMLLPKTRRKAVECRNVLHLGRFPYRIVYALVDDEIYGRCDCTSSSTAALLGRPPRRST